MACTRADTFHTLDPNLHDPWLGITETTGERFGLPAVTSPINVVTSLMCHLKRHLRYGSYDVTKFNRTIVRCVTFKRTMLSNVLTAKAISRALLSSYLTRYIKNIYSVATNPLQFRNGVDTSFE